MLYRLVSAIRRVFVLCSYYREPNEVARTVHTTIKRKKQKHLEVEALVGRWQRRAGLAACCRGARYGPVWCVADLEHLPGREEYYYGGKYTYRSYNVPRSYGTVK